jgi:hypothetical protein
MKKTLISLRHIYAGLLLSAVTFQLAAQTDSLVNMPNLLLPKFTKSVVKLKSGKINTAVLNYNKVDQEMVFFQNKQTLILDEPQLIDTVFMANRTFVPFEKGFYELAVKAPVTLFIQHKSYVEFEGYPTLYGAKSQTTAPSYVRQIYGSNGAIDLKIPKGYKVIDDTQFWIRKIDGMTMFDTKREFLKIFPDKEKELSQFISKNKVNFDNNEDVVKLVTYCNEISK